MPEATKSSPTRPRRVQDVAQRDIETEVAAVGFGGTAIEATDAGSQTSVFELASGMSVAGASLSGRTAGISVSALPRRYF